MSYLTEIGKRLRQIRTELDMNQTEMGKIIDRKQRAVSYYEQGRLPDQEALRVLYSMGYSIDWLLTGEGRMHLRKDKRQLSLDTLARTFLNGIQDGIFVIQEGIYRFANKAMANMIGYSVEELVNKPVGSITNPKRRRLLLREFRRIFRGKETPVCYTFQLNCKDGTTLDVLATFSRIQYEGEPALLALIRDISGRKMDEFEDIPKILSVLNYT